MLVCVLLRKVSDTIKNLHGTAVSSSNIYMYLTESFPDYMTSHFIFFKLPSFSSPKCTFYSILFIVFYSILFYSILFYSIQFHSILFNISQKLPNKYYFKVW